MPVLEDRLTKLLYNPSTQETTEVPFNLNDGTVDKVMLRLVDQTGADKVNAEMTILVGSQGDVSYSWDAADVDTAGMFTAIEEVYYVGGGVQAAPSFHVEI